MPNNNIRTMFEVCGPLDIPLQGRLLTIEKTEEFWTQNKKWLFSKSCG